MASERVPGEVALHLDREGSGTPLLCLIHGFGGSARNWRPQMRALRARCTVAAFDVRGHARSEAPADPAAYAPERFVADVGRVLDHCGATADAPGPRPVVGGLSMGAGIALRFALAHPERIGGLVLAAFPPAATTARDGGDPAGTRQRAWALAFADAIEREDLDAAGARYAWGPESGFDPATARLVRAGFLEHPPHAIAHTLRGLLARQPGIDELADALAGFDRPVLVLVGALDRLSRRSSEALARALPRAELVVVEGAGHVVNLADREATNAALERFLDGLAGEADGRAAPPGRP